MKASLVFLLALTCTTICAKPVDDEPQQQPVVDQSKNQEKSESDQDQPEARIAELPLVEINQQDNFHQYVVSNPELEETQFKAFDTEGRYSFGYSLPNHARLEARNDDGSVLGTYVYQDPSGKQNQVQYQAGKNGFLVAANNLPVFNPVLPAPVQDTPEVEAAKKEHLKVWDARFKLQHPDSSKYTAPLDVSSAPSNDDVVVDAARQAVIVDKIENEDVDPFDFESDPVKLLAFFYTRHLSATSNQRPEVIERPKNFYPSNLAAPVSDVHFDMFSRPDKEAIVITNPEYVDLKNFLLTNRFRSGLPQQSQDQSSQKQNLPAADPKPSEDKTLDAKSKTDDALKVKISEDKSQVSRPIIAQNYQIFQELYNRYFNLPADSKPILTREAFLNLPESLKAVAYGIPAIDGYRDAQVAPYQKNFSPYSRFGQVDEFLPYWTPYQQDQYYPENPYFVY